MQVENWPIANVKPYAGNPRTIPQDAIDTIAAALQEYDWQQPLVVDADGVLIVGHGRLAAAKQLGMATVPVQVAKNLTPAQVKAYRIADNRTGEIAGWDDEKLAQELQQIVEGAQMDLGALEDATMLSPATLQDLLVMRPASAGEGEEPAPPAFTAPARAEDQAYQPKIGETAVTGAQVDQTAEAAQAARAGLRKTEKGERCMSNVLNVVTRSASTGKDEVELASWLEAAPWTFAKTMKEHPHSYTRVYEWPAGSKRFYEAVRRIRRFGFSARFLNRAYLYWQANGWQYWTMGAPVGETILINRATAAYVDAGYDQVADGYDATYADLSEESQAAFDLLPLEPHHAVLDVGCGTGLALDVQTGMEHTRYCGIDPSTRMLEIARRKHPQFARHFLPCTLADCYALGKYDRVLLMFGVPNYCTPKDLERVPALLKPDGEALLMWFAPGYTPRTEVPGMTVYETPAHVTEIWRDKYALQRILAPPAVAA